MNKIITYTDEQNTSAKKRDLMAGVMGIVIAIIFAVIAIKIPSTTPSVIALITAVSETSIAIWIITFGR